MSSTDKTEKKLHRLPSKLKSSILKIIFLYKIVKVLHKPHVHKRFWTSAANLGKRNMGSSVEKDQNHQKWPCCGDPA